MYYGILAAAVLMFGLQFFCNDKYQSDEGSDPVSAVRLIFGSSLAGALVLFALSGFSVSLTPFTLIMSVATAADFMVMIYCSTLALGKTSLSVYSMFSQIGGMAIPFVAGIAFYGEEMTLGKGICIILVLGAVLATVRGSCGGGLIYCFGIFAFNGLLGILSKIYEESQHSKASVLDYSVWTALIAAVISGVILLFMKGGTSRINRRSALLIGGYGALNKVGNYLLLVSLARLPASVQYPMVTGGVIITSTLLSYFTPKKPGVREYLSLLLALLGIAALVLV